MLPDFNESAETATLFFLSMKAATGKCFRRKPPSRPRVSAGSLSEGVWK
jgi:hypothetical protein